MIKMGKECGFRLNFAMPQPCKTEELLAQNGEQPIRLPNGLLYPRVVVEQRTHSGDEGCYS